MSVTFTTNNYGLTTATFSGTGTLSGATVQLTDSNGKTATIAIIEGYSSIGADAFDGASSLTSITIPASVTIIGDYSFKEASSLT